MVRACSKGRLVGMLLSLLVLYLGVRAAGLAFFILDLLAKSYDLPTEQLRAKVALVGLAALACAGAAHFGGASVAAASTQRAQLVVLVVLIPPLLGLLCCLYLLDWRSVYAASIVMLLSVLIVWPWQPWRAGVATTLLLAVVVAGTFSQRAAFRLRRYARVLHRSCSCCGSQQRAVHELCSFGETGHRIIDYYLDGFESWQETRIREEWQRCGGPPA